MLLIGLMACSADVAEPEPVRAVRVMQLSAEAPTVRHEYAAEIRPRTESQLAFRVSGQMQRRLVDLGQAVKPGQVLATLDPKDLQLGQAAARAATLAAQVQYEQTEADFARYQDLRAQGFISAAELQQRETTLKAARAQWEQARAQAGLQVNQAGYASLVADVAGVVTAVTAEPGAVVAAGSPIVRVAHDGPRDAVFSVPEDRVGAYRALLGVAGALQVRGWAPGSPTVPAVVREVAAAADASTRTFLVKADVGRTALALGQTATVLEQQSGAPSAIRIPLSAVLNRQGSAAVWLVDPDSMTVQARPISVAGADGNLVIVAAGLQPGQTVVTAGVHVLTPGQKVRLYQAPATAAPAPAASR